MSEYVHLIGAEQVQSAAVSMRGAAEEMRQAAMTIDGALERHRLFMDDWLQKLEQVLSERIPCHCSVCGHQERLEYD
ncbi:MAG TPA: hypothetical protein DCK83_02155 [Gallionellaceae bacterium]|nr:hypothetical protein [Gallionellaceae bacterium]